MATRFDSLTMTKLQQLITVPVFLKENADYYRGDHWQNTKGWAGPIPTGDGAALLLKEIEKAFVSQNKIAEAVNRHASGVVGREPVWGLTVRRPLKPGKQPMVAERALIDEAEALLTNWWDERGIHQVIQEMVQTALWATRAVLRFYVPPDVLEADEAGDLRSSATTMDEALNMIWLDSPAPDQAVVHRDRHSMQQIGIYSYALTDDDLPEGDDSPRQRVELTYLDRAVAGDMQSATNQRLSVLEIAWSDGKGARVGPPAGPVRMQLDGHLLMAQLDLPLLVTEPVKSQQRLLNLAWSMMARNTVMGGFLERIIMDGEVPGYYVEDSSAPGGRQFVATPLKVGAGVTNFIQGRVLETQEGKPFLDPQGRPVVATPQYIRNDPVPPDTFTATAEAAKRAILEEVHQLHTLISGDAAASGESRRQAMADFLSDLLTSAGRINIIGRWLIETTLAFAAYLSGTPGRYDSLRATFVCRIDPGPIPADELRLVLERVEKGLLSTESGMELTGVDDTEAEKARLAEDAAAKATRAPTMTQRIPAESNPPTSEQGSDPTNSQGGANANQ